MSAKLVLLLNFLGISALRADEAQPIDATVITALQGLGVLPKSPGSGGVPLEKLKPKDIWENLWYGLLHINWIEMIQKTLKITIIIAVCYGLVVFLDRLTKRFNRKIDQADINDDHTNILQNISPIACSVGRWIVRILATLMVLNELNINIMPIVYSMSVLGLAFTIGAQALVKDLINGILTLIEGTISVGEKVVISHYQGYVESISLRCVHIRDDSGSLHTIPFSDVSSLTNLSRNSANLTLTITVEPTAQIKEIEQVYCDAEKQAREKLNLGADIKPMVFRGISEVNTKGVVIVGRWNVPYAQCFDIQYAFNNTLLALCQERNIPLTSGVSA